MEKFLVNCLLRADQGQTEYGINKLFVMTDQCYQFVITQLVNGKCVFVNIFYMVFIKTALSFVM